ncbi:MAG: polyprenyl diphosphate synthase [Bacilli bacterium]|nr:polyprenyl diphosphate synthase [Bacilli bacterium]
MYTICMVSKTPENNLVPFKLLKPIHHIAFIMDGNGRWAKARGLPRHLGHKEACERIIDVLNNCMEFGIRVISLYAFSTENWKRPKAEINHLFNYLDLFFKRELATLIKDDVRVHISGDINGLPLKTQKTIVEAIEKTAHCQKHIMNICLNYGGQQEIIYAVKGIATKIQSQQLKVSDINETLFANHLYTASLPPVDLMIRTSGEYRLSNFLLWQNAYAEFIFPNVHWPDFNKEQLIACLREFESRNRRFGGLKNE